MKKKWIVIALAACAIALAGCKVVSEPEPIAVESVTLSEATLTLAPGATKKLTATVKPDNADDKTVKWSSSNTAVATVGDDGTVTAVKEGTTTITAQADGKTATCTVTVKSNPIAVESVTLDATTLTLAPGATSKLMATVNPDNADDKSVKWSSSDTSVAMVGSDGTIGAIKTGTTIITAQAGDKTAICVVTVKEAVVANPDSPVVNPDSPVAVEGVTLNAETLTIEPGKTRTLTATVTPINADDKTVKWSSSNTTVATVVDGAVTAVAEGTATIIAQAGDKTATCAVNVPSQDVGGADDNEKDFVINDGILVNYTGASSTVTIPAKVTQIGSGAFSGCGKLTEVTIPEGVTSIEADAFKGCGSLTTVNIPATLTKIVLYAFEGCKNIKTVNYGGTLAQWCSMQNDSRLTMNANSVILNDGKDLKTLTELKIPKGVQCIGDFAFVVCECLRNVTIGSEVNIIGWCAFSGCTALESIVIPDSVMDIGKEVFWGCKSLTSVTIPASVKNIRDYAFSGCKNLMEITIPNGVESIGESAFSGCENLTDITIPNGVKSIGFGAFQDCLRLAKVSIPAGMKNIGRFAFYNCSANLVLYYDGTQSQWNAIEGIDSILLVKGTEIHGNDTTWSVK